MRVLYYTYPYYFDTSLPLIRALKSLVELHLILALPPEGWRKGLFEAIPMDLPAGLVPADSILRHSFPPSVQKYWEGLASFNLAVYRNPRSIHPATWMTSCRVRKAIEAIVPDIVHVEEGCLRAACMLLGLRRVPLVLTIHDPEVHLGEADWRVNVTRWLLFRKAKAFVLYNSSQRDQFCTVNHVLRKKVHHLRLGACDVFREYATASVETEGSTVLMFGRQSPYKGLDVLYQAAPIIARKVPGLRFIVAGRPNRGYLPPSPPALPNGARVDLVTEYICNAHLANLFQRATLVALPYIEATQSGVLLTAYAFDKPVVATRTGGLPEYVEDGITGLLVPPGDAGAFADAAVKLLCDEGLRRHMSATIRERRCGGRLSWIPAREGLHRAYGEVISC